MTSYQSETSPDSQVAAVLQVPEPDAARVHSTPAEATPPLASTSELHTSGHPGSPRPRSVSPPAGESRKCPRIHSSCSGTVRGSSSAASRLVVSNHPQYSDLSSILQGPEVTLVKTMRKDTQTVPQEPASWATPFSGPPAESFEDVNATLDSMRDGLSNSFDVSPFNPDYGDGAVASSSGWSLRYEVEPWLHLRDGHWFPLSYTLLQVLFIRGVLRCTCCIVEPVDPGGRLV